VRKLWIALLLAGCSPTTTDTGPRYAGDHPAPATLPSERKPKCDFATAVTKMPFVSEQLPAGTTEDEALSAAAQFLTTLGIKILAKDDIAHTMITEEFTGQTIAMTCRPINEYRSYELRVAVAGRNMVVTMGCRRSFGWEAHDGAPMRRGPIEKCDPDAYVSAGDATIQRNLVEGTIQMLQLRSSP
jgi:hypothetical protein